jgi:hypothetical protein
MISGRILASDWAGFLPARHGRKSPAAVERDDGAEGTPRPTGRSTIYDIKYVGATSPRTQVPMLRQNIMRFRDDPIKALTPDRHTALTKPVGCTVARLGAVERQRPEHPNTASPAGPLGLKTLGYRISTSPGLVGPWLEGRS